jgi:hypothetical protein
MFHLLGSPRSGTTILAQCISAHPDLIIPDETDLIVPLTFIASRIKDESIGRELISKLVVNSERFQYSLGEYLTKDQAIACVEQSAYHPAAILGSIYSSVAAATGKKIAGDKSPNDLLVVRELFGYGTLGADSKIIHIVRDIRDVMVSLRKTGWAPPDLDGYYPRLWGTNNLYLNYKMQDCQNYVLIRYEDFVETPELFLRKICEMLEVPYCDGMLDTEARHKRYEGVGHHSNIYKPLSKDSIGIYKKNLDQKILAHYEEQAMDALLKFGYAKTWNPMKLFKTLFAWRT